MSLVDYLQTTQPVPENETDFPFSLVRKEMHGIIDSMAARVLKDESREVELVKVWDEYKTSDSFARNNYILRLRGFPIVKDYRLCKIGEMTTLPVDVKTSYALIDVEGEGTRYFERFPCDSPETIWVRMEKIDTNA